MTSVTGTAAAADGDFCATVVSTLCHGHAAATYMSTPLQLLLGPFSAGFTFMELTEPRLIIGLSLAQPFLDQELLHELDVSQPLLRAEPLSFKASLGAVALQELCLHCSVDERERLGIC